MSVRYCTRCAADVQDAGGFCLLGHPLVDREPENAPVAHAWGGLDIGRLPEDASDAPQEPLANPYEALAAENASDADDELDSLPARQRAVWAALNHSDEVAAGDPISHFAPAGRMDWGPEKERKRGLRQLARRPRPTTA